MTINNIVRRIRLRVLSILLVALLFHVFNSYAQSYNQEKTALTNFLVRMYENAPFDDVKAVEDYEDSYLM